MTNPLSNIDGPALRSQSEWLLLFKDTSHYRSLKQHGKDAVDGLVNLLDEIRSYCHDAHGFDCLLHEDEPPAKPCSVCGSATCIG